MQEFDAAAALAELDAVAPGSTARRSDGTVMDEDPLFWVRRRLSREADMASDLVRCARHRAAMATAIVVFWVTYSADRLRRSAKLARVRAAAAARAAKAAAAVPRLTPAQRRRGEDDASLRRTDEREVAQRAKRRRQSAVGGRHASCPSDSTLSTSDARVDRASPAIEWARGDDAASRAVAVALFGRGGGGVSNGSSAASISRQRRGGSTASTLGVGTLSRSRGL